MSPAMLNRSQTLNKVQTNRLPAADQESNRRGQIAKGALALLGTIAIVVGVPIALLAAFGAPWPDTMPTRDWLSSPTTGETVLAVLAVIVWLAWLHFVICLVVEAVAERRNRGLAPHIPGGGMGTQTLARRLVATIVLLAAATSVGMSSASAATTSASPVSDQVTSASVAPLTSQAGALDGALPAAGTLESATSEDIAEGITTYYDVKPHSGRHYDTLWDMADRFLGDGLRYKEIWELNKNVTQPDGRVLKNADLIYPGWVMKLPNDAKGPGLKVVDHAAASDSSPAPESTSTARAAADSAVIAKADSNDQAGGGIGISSSWSPFFGVAGGLALAGALLGLRRRRASTPTAARWLKRTSGGPDPRDPTPTPPTPGSRLRDEADTETASWLNRALRSLSPSMPAPVRVSVGDGGIAMAFEDAPEVEPPRGWTARDKVWMLDRQTSIDGAGAAPLPGLASIGRRDDGSVLLIDPESIPGVVAFDGDSDTARGLGLSMAVDTATHLWADNRVVTLVGFAGDVSSIGQGSIRRTDDLERVFESLENVARFQRAACRRVGAPSVRAARAAVDAAGDWAYHLVVCSGVPSGDQLSRLSALAADPQIALGVVIIGEVPDAALRLTARPDGRISSPIHGVDVIAQVLTVDAAKSLAALYEPLPKARRVGINDLVDSLEAEQEAVVSPAALAQLRILGPVALSASGHVEPERTVLLTELACFLALHPAGAHVNRISAALWPRGVDNSVRDGALGQLATWVGAAADGTSLLQQESGVWRFAPGAVDLDWDSFRTALNQAAHGGERREAHFRRALDLVSGLPFADAPVGRYAWLEAMSIEGDIVMAVSLTVQACAEAAVAHDDEPAARAALIQGLTLLPANEELWRSRLRLTQHFGGRDDVEAVVEEMYAAIAEHGSIVGSAAETDALVDELLPGYRSHVA